MPFVLLAVIKENAAFIKEALDGGFPLWCKVGFLQCCYMRGFIECFQSIVFGGFVPIDVEGDDSELVVMKNGKVGLCGHLLGGV